MKTHTSLLSNSQVLVVDDNDANVEQLAMLLEDAGYTSVHGTTDPTQVIRMTGELHPDIILLDLMMPVMDGFEVMEALNETLPPDEYLPVVVLTADISDESRDRALRLGANDFITKPFDHGEVLLRIRNHLETRRLHRQLQERNIALDNAVTERSAELGRSMGEQRRLQDALLAQEGLKAIGQMASGIAHDFNNAVAIIMGTSELYLTFDHLLFDRDGLVTTFKIINDAARDASHIVSRLREFYNPARDPSEPRSTDLKAAIKSAVVLTTPKWREQTIAEGRPVTIDVAAKVVPVAMALSDLREILVNLIFNAVDAMPEGGAIEISGVKEGSFGILTVHDSGVGMDAATRDKCLEMFFSTKGDKGTGLGLGMVADLVSRHHGSISVQSELGRGTTFTIRLPLSGELGVEDVARVDRLHRSLHVLVVDDDPEVLAMVSKCLQRDGHTTVTAEDGRSGLGCFFREHFDLVISDHAMPLINGEQLARAIRKNAPNQPVFAMSGFDNSEIESLERFKGIANRFFHKPVALHDLRKALVEVFQPEADSVGS